MSRYTVRCREPQGHTYDYPVMGLGDTAPVSFVNGRAELDEHDPRLGAFRGNPRYTVTQASEETG